MIRNKNHSYVLWKADYCKKAGIKGLSIEAALIALLTDPFSQRFATPELWLETRYPNYNQQEAEAVKALWADRFVGDQEPVESVRVLNTFDPSTVVEALPEDEPETGGDDSGYTV